MLLSERHHDLYAYNWRHLKSKHLTYAVGCIDGRQILAHRLIGEIEGWDMDGKVIDHINGDGLDNRIENLQVVTQSQNMMKQRKPKGCSSKLKGVSRFRDKWRARITLQGKIKHLGLYETELDAAIAYNEAALEYFGKYARLNDIDWPTKPE